MKQIIKSRKPISSHPTANIIQRGWEVLSEGIGPTGALRFIMSFTSGRGDSVKIIKKLWKDKTIEEIHQEILKAKKEKKI